MAACHVALASLLAQAIAWWISLHDFQHINSANTQAPQGRTMSHRPSSKGHKQNMRTETLTTRSLDLRKDAAFEWRHAQCKVGTVSNMRDLALGMVADYPRECRAVVAQEGLRNT